MPISRYSFPEHDLTLLVTRGKHTGQDVIQTFQSMDASCATRWLKYIDETTDMSEVYLSNLPVMRRVKAEKRRELFGDSPKPSAVVCDASPSGQILIEFWQRYTDLGERCFRSLDEAYDWLGLSEAARDAVAHALDEDANAGPRRPSAAPSEPAFPGP